MNEGLIYLIFISLLSQNYAVEDKEVKHFSKDYDADWIAYQKNAPATSQLRDFGSDMYSL